MRIVTEIPQEDFKITIYSWNGKYLVKFERGNYEQTYKVSELDLTGDEEIRKLIEDKYFLKSVKERFISMSKDFNEGLSRIYSL
jgi:hypothetical protein